MIKKGSPEWLALHEQRLAIMRAKFHQERLWLRQTARRGRRRKYSPRDALTPRGLAHAIRIAAKMARDERPTHNPAFVEALEVAATFFDDIDTAEQPST